jgi:hypothetical protein
LVAGAPKSKPSGRTAGEGSRRAKVDGRRFGHCGSKVERREPELSRIFGSA